MTLPTRSHGTARNRGMAQVAIETVNGVRLVSVGAEHDCRWFTYAMNCTTCQAQYVLVVCACESHADCPDCGTPNELPESWQDYDPE